MVGGGTFTITNPGVFGALFGMPIISQPQVAILGVGDVEKRPVVVDDAIAIRPMAYLTLATTTGVVDGAVGRRVPLSIVKKSLENWDPNAAQQGRRAGRRGTQVGTAGARLMRRLGRSPYPGCARSTALARRGSTHAGRVGDVLLLLEHPPCAVARKSAEGQRSHARILLTPDALASRGVESPSGPAAAANHLPRATLIVGYPIIDLDPDRRDVHRYVRDLETVLIRVAADYGIDAGRVEGLTGVWVGDEKLAAIGVRIARWITSHGFAFNVTTDLDYFNLIVPCGIADRGVTSLARLLGRPVDTAEVENRIIEHFSNVFDLNALAI